MDPRHFDDLTRALARPATRREAVRRAATVLAAGVTGLSRLGRASAAECANRVPNPTHIPSSNGCGTASAPVSGVVGKVDITPACDQHDLCYDSCDRVKADCDEAFNTAMRAICAAGNPCGSQELSDCYNATNVYYRAVKFFGSAAFDAAQQSACLCCRDKEIRCGSVCCPAGLCFGQTCLTHLWSR